MVENRRLEGPRVPGRPWRACVWDRSRARFQERRDLGSRRSRQRPVLPRLPRARRRLERLGADRRLGRRPSRDDDYRGGRRGRGCMGAGQGQYLAPPLEVAIVAGMGGDWAPVGTDVSHVTGRGGPSRGNHRYRGGGRRRRSVVSHVFLAGGKVFRMGIDPWQDVFQTGLDVPGRQPFRPLGEGRVRQTLVSLGCDPIRLERIRDVGQQCSGSGITRYAVRDRSHGRPGRRPDYDCVGGHRQQAVRAIVGRLRPGGRDWAAYREDHRHPRH